MPLYDIAFYCASFFLGGVALAGLGASPGLALVMTGAGICMMVSMGAMKRSGVFFIFAAFCAVCFAGFFYYHAYLVWTRPTIKAGARTEFEAVVSSYPQWRLTSQKFSVELKDPGQGTVTVLASAYPRYSYGDTLRISGVPEEKTPGMMQVAFPDIERAGGGAGSPVRAALFAWRERMTRHFQGVLAPDEAALMAGLTFGDRAGFSKRFQDNLQGSGTTHIVALSGYNISLVVSLVGVLFAYFLSRRASFVVSLFVIALFIVVTGAEASAVRAAIMGIIALLAIHVGRLYSFRNAITFAALLMVIANPRTLVFDIGFQLSFAALLGIVYLLPAMRIFFDLSPDRGLLGWKENALASCAAELAVLPIVLKYFGAFSLFSLFANVLILEVVPVVTVLGFALGALGYLSGFLAALMGMGVRLLLGYVIFVIHLFAKISPMVSLPSSNMVMACYYAAVIGFVLYAHYGITEPQKISASS